MVDAAPAPFQDPTSPWHFLHPQQGGVKTVVDVLSWTVQWPERWMFFMFTTVYTSVYIYICVCVCACICIYINCHLYPSHHLVTYATPHAFTNWLRPGPMRASSIAWRSAQERGVHHRQHSPSNPHLQALVLFMAADWDQLIQAADCPTKRGGCRKKHNK